MKSLTNLIVFLMVLATTTFYVVNLLPLESNKDSLDPYDNYDDYGEQQDQAKSDEGGGDDDDDDEDLEEYGNAPISKGGRIDVVEGSTAILPCEVTNMNGPYNWIKGNHLIFTTNIAIGAKINKKLKVATNHSLIVPDVNAAEDQDTYTCRIYDYKKPINITYRLEVHRKNRVQIDVVPDTSSSSSSKNHHIELGTSFSLECYAIIVDARRHQRIRWFKDGHTLPTVIVQSRASLAPRTIYRAHAAQLNHTGDYQCLLDDDDNSDGVTAPPLLHAVHITVLYKPQVRVPNAIVNTAVDYEAQLMCEYAGEPQPNVYWIRNGMRLVAVDNRYEIGHDYTRNYSRFVLRIVRVHDSDFGQFMCLATNRYGFANATIELTRKPAIVAATRTTVIDAWTIDSIAPILRTELHVRRPSDTLRSIAIDDDAIRLHANTARNSYVLPVPWQRIVNQLRGPEPMAHQPQLLTFDLNLTVSNQFGSSTHLITNISANTITSPSRSGSQPDDRENMIVDQQEIVSTPSSATPIVISILNVLVSVTIIVTTSATTAIFC